jgi:hypothetical protein
VADPIAVLLAVERERAQWESHLDVTRERVAELRDAGELDEAHDILAKSQIHTMDYCDKLFLLLRETLSQTAQMKQNGESIAHLMRELRTLRQEVAALREPR